MDFPAHPAGGSVTGQYFTSADGQVKVPALVLGDTFPTVKNDILNYKWKTGDFLLATYPKNGE